MTDSNKKILATLLASLMMVSMVGAAFAPATAGASGPSGMLALGDAQVHEDIPEGADVPIGAADLEGAIYASDHADTLEAIVTTPERAEEEYLDAGTIVTNDEVALVLRDDEVHDGREVAVELALLETAVGFAPEVAYGVHESGEEWQSPIDRDGEVGVFEVPEFSDNTVTFSGGITLSGDAAGDGTSYEYELDNLDGVDNFAIDLTGVDNTENVTESGSGSDGDTTPIDIAGNAQPNGATLSLTGSQSQIDSGGKEIIGSAVGDTLTQTIDFGSANATELESGFVWDADNVQSVDIKVDIHVDGVFVGQLASSAGSASTASDSQTFDAPDLSGEKQITWEITQLDASEDVPIEASTSQFGGAGYYLRGYDTTASVTTESGDGVALDGDKTASGPVTLNESGETLSFSGDPINWQLDYQAKTQTRDPVVELNGYETSYDGTLAEGETTSLATNEAWLEEGTNTVTVSTNSPTTGPESLTGFEYAHDASGTTQSVEVDATSWTESFNVSNTYPSATADTNAVLTFSDRVAEIDDVEYRLNGGEWQSPPDHELNGTDLDVQIGDVEADTTVDVRATGHKIRTYDGDVDIVEPTIEGDDLATEVQITDINPDGMFGLRVDGTELGDRVHYATEESWSGESAHVDIAPSGTQILRAPDANVGSTMTVRSSPISVEPESGGIEVLVEDGDEPRFSVREGDTVGTSTLDVTYHDTLSGERYVLWSVTQDREIDADRASSPVYFTTDGSAETYTIRQLDREGSGGGAAPAAGGAAAPLVLVLPAVGLSVTGLFWAGRRFGGARGVRGNGLLLVGSTVISAAALELVTPGSLIAQLWSATVFALGDAAASGLGAVVASIATLLGLWQIQTRTRADIPAWVLIPTVSLAGVLALESIRPGSVLGALEGVIAEIGALIALILVAFWIYRWRQRSETEREEASTPDTQVTLDLGDEGRGDD